MNFTKDHCTLDIMNMLFIFYIEDEYMYDTCRVSKFRLG